MLARLACWQHNGTDVRHAASKTQVFAEKLSEIIAAANIEVVEDLSMDRNTNAFVSLLTASQPGLYACILALLPDRVAAHDVLQETNLTLWQKAEDFEPGTSFMAWATRIARYHVLNHRRKMKRDRLVFDEVLFEELAARQAMRADDADRYARALRHCLGKLPHEQQDLVAQRYAANGSVKQIAGCQGRSVGAVSQTLYRIREALLNCISQRVQQGLL